MLLLQILSQFEKEGIEHLVSGGYALCLNGAVRPTLDIDILVPQDFNDENQYPSILWSLSNFDFSYVPENSNSNLKVFQHSNKEILNLHIDPFFHTYRSKNIRIHSHNISIIHPSDLILIKKKNSTEQNVLDIQALRTLYE